MELIETSSRLCGFRIDEQFNGCEDIDPWVELLEDDDDTTRSGLDQMVLVKGQGYLKSA